uniref:Ectonucleotide pyrophosphatase/phosphodiesterase family member 3 n=1 Tax=Zea mays TaxID=4577 RepID=A0A804QNE8_MAIZE
MKDSQSTTELQSSAQGTNEVQSQQPNPMTTDAPAGNSGSLSIASNDSKKVQNLIERCLQLYMNKGEVVRTLSTRARIEPGFTTLVWQKLEEENSEFFRAYYIRLKLKRQIILFNHLLQHQYNLMKYPAPPNVPLAPIQNGIHHMPVSNLPMGYPVLPQPIMPAPGQPHMDPMACGLSNGHVVNGIPAPGGYHPMRMNSGNDMVVDNGAPEAPHAGATGSVMSSEMAVSPSSAASSNHAPFMPPEIPGMAMDVPGLDSTFGSDVGNGPLQLGPDGSSRDSIRSLGQLWNFSLSDLTADLTSLGDLDVLENYTGTPFLPSDSDILLDSPDQDDIVEYFADAINGSQSDEERS